MCLCVTKIVWISFKETPASSRRERIVFPPPPSTRKLSLPSRSTKQVLYIFVTAALPVPRIVRFMVCPPVSLFLFSVYFQIRRAATESFFRYPRQKRNPKLSLRIPFLLNQLPEYLRHWHFLCIKRSANSAASTPRVALKPCPSSGKTTSSACSYVSCAFIE